MGGGGVTPIYGVDRYGRPIVYGFFEGLHPKIRFHFCPCWRCVLGMIIR